MCQILTVSKFRLIRKIGEGGFGAVWVAKNTQDNSIVALKEILSPNMSGHERKALERYAKLSNCSESEGPAPIDGIIPILEVFTENGKTYYAMPLCDGTDKSKSPTDSDWEPLTLDARIENRRTQEKWFSAKEVADIIIPIFTAAAKLNDEGFIHRDIKPANILFFNGKPCLADIGLLAEDRLSVSSAGTPDFTAPNWYVNGNPDMWGCAATLFKLLTGNPPDLMGRGAYLWQPCGKENMNFADVQIWRNMNNAINRATAEKPKDRYLRFYDFIADVRTASEGGKIAQLQVAANSGGKKIKIFAAVALAAVAGALAYFAAKPSSSDSAETPHAMPAQDKYAFARSLNVMSREELVNLAGDLSAKIQKESDNKKTFELFKKLLAVSSKIVPSVPGQEIPCLPWALRGISGANPLSVLKKSEAAARATNHADIADKIKKSFDDFEPQYVSQLPKEDRRATLKDMANEILSMQDPKEIKAAFLRLAKLAVGNPSIHINRYISHNTAIALNDRGGIDIEALFKKAEQAYADTQDRSTADKIREALWLYQSEMFNKKTRDEQKKVFGEIAKKIESSTSPDETLAQFQKIVINICGNPAGKNLLFVARQMERLLGAKADAILKKVEDAYTATGDTEMANEIGRNRKDLAVTRGRFQER